MVNTPYLAIPGAISRAVSLFSYSVEQNTQETQMTMRMTEGVRTEKERLLAV